MGFLRLVDWHERGRREKMGKGDIDK